MTAKEFMNRMLTINQNACYFALMGYHVSIDLSVNCETCVLTVHYDDPSDKDFLIQHSSSSLTCLACESNGYHWIKMY